MKLKHACLLCVFALTALFFAGYAVRSQGSPRKKIRPISYRDFVKIEKKDPYFKGRWTYFSIVIDLIQKIQPESVLELGPYRLPLVKGGDTMDIVKVLKNLTYLHDATQTPWPIADKKYDLFIACEVWEHLGHKQKEAFQEVMRISRRAIMSFPYKWKYPKNAKDEEALLHRDIDEAKIADWTLHQTPSQILFSDNQRYAVYYFEFNSDEPVDSRHR
jgi:hypothetical protein